MSKIVITTPNDTNQHFVEGLGIDLHVIGTFLNAPHPGTLPWHRDVFQLMQLVVEEKTKVLCLGDVWTGEVPLSLLISLNDIMRVSSVHTVLVPCVYTTSEGYFHLQVFSIRPGGKVSASPVSIVKQNEFYHHMVSKARSAHSSL